MSELIRREDIVKAFHEFNLTVSPMDAINVLPTVNAIPIPEGATNGDMIVDMLPKNITIRDDGLMYTVFLFADCKAVLSYSTEIMSVSKDWWNAPYKKEVE